jgi:myo-inositol-1-phosphate synthase
VLSEQLWKPYAAQIERIPLLKAPPSFMGLKDQVEQLNKDIQAFMDQYPHALPVLINLLPAGIQKNWGQYDNLTHFISKVDPAKHPDIAYIVAAILSGVPVVNFTPNDMEPPVLLNEAKKRGVPVAGRDGKTGQTYLKVALASALKARNLLVDGWYSLNILGNEDGKNLMDPEKAAGKTTNKTEVLDEILGYPIGEKYGASSHKVHIDYYPPRGDAKEAWDVVDFTGLFGLPMSIRINLLARDSILAAPLVLDLARWMAVLKMAGLSGPIPELGFYFKKPVGKNPPLTFQDQLAYLDRLKQKCDQKIFSEATDRDEEYK